MLQVVEDAKVRAFSANGVRWQLQVLTERPQHTWRSDTAASADLQFINWGIWSAQTGLTQVPANPMLDLGRMQEQADILLNHLPKALALLPFEPVDTYEYWACDVQDNPLALLASRRQHAPNETLPNRWIAHATADEPFHSSSLREAGVDPDQISHARYLEALIDELAPKRCWLHQRQHDYENLTTGQVLANTAVPLLGITEQWQDEQCRAAFTDWTNWNAPMLLTLHGLGERRIELEQQAAQRASLVDDLHRLYPRMANPTLIEQIRVQAHLQR